MKIWLNLARNTHTHFPSKTVSFHPKNSREKSKPEIMVSIVLKINHASLVHKMDPEMIHFFKSLPFQVVMTAGCFSGRCHVRCTAKGTPSRCTPPTTATSSVWPSIHRTFESSREGMMIKWSFTTWIRKKSHVPRSVTSQPLLFQDEIHIKTAT